MSDRAIPELPAALELEPSHELVIWQAGVTSRVTLEALAAYLGTTGGNGGGEPPPISAGRWRIRRLTSTSSFTVGFAEVYFGTAATGGTVLKSSEENTGTSAAANAFDGNPATHWKTTAGQIADAYIGYAWTTAVTVTQVTLTAINDSAASGWTPTGFAVERSDDGVTWVEEWREEALPSWTAGEQRTFTKP